MSVQKEARAEKKAIVREIRDQLEKSQFVFLADYKGMNVAKAADLRGQLLPVRAQFHVVKNSYFAQAVQGLPCEAAGKGLTGPTAMICGAGDVVETAKAVRKFIRDNRLPEIKGGAMQATILSAGDVEKLAGLPSRPELLARAVGTIAAPMMNLVGVMSQKLSSLVYVLKAIEEKKQTPTA